MDRAQVSLHSASDFRRIRISLLDFGSIVKCSRVDSPVISKVLFINRLNLVSFADRIAFVVTCSDNIINVTQQRYVIKNRICVIRSVVDSFV